MTESGFEMPPDHIVSQIRSTLDFSSPVIMIPSCLSPSSPRTCTSQPPRIAPWVSMASMASMAYEPSRIKRKRTRCNPSGAMLLACGPQERPLLGAR